MTAALPLSIVSLTGPSHESNDPCLPARLPPAVRCDIVHISRPVVRHTALDLRHRHTEVCLTHALAGKARMFPGNFVLNSANLRYALSSELPADGRACGGSMIEV